MILTCMALDPYVALDAALNTQFARECMKSFTFADIKKEFSVYLITDQIHLTCRTENNYSNACCALECRYILLLEPVLKNSGSFIFN